MTLPRAILAIAACALAGNTVAGAAIGAGAGLVGGLVVDKVQKDKEAAYQRGVAEGQSGN